MENKDHADDTMIFTKSEMAANRVIKSMSKGTLQKIGVIQALVKKSDVSLVKALSDKTYSIYNGRLQEYKPVINIFYNIDIDNPNNNPIPEGAIRYGTGYRIHVNEKDIQKTVLHLMQNGWILKGVSEVNDKDDKISATDLF